MALGLMHNYSKLSPSVQRQYAQFGLHIETQQLILNKDNYCVSRVEMNESYPFLLVCIDLSRIEIRRDFAEFIDLDREKEIYFELSIAQQRLINLEDDQLPLQTFNHLYRNSGFTKLEFYQRNSKISNGDKSE